MKLQAFERQGNINQVRRAGNIPAVLYGDGKKVENIIVSGAEFRAFLRKGRLSTKVITLEMGDTKIRVLVKDIQYNPTNYEPIHVDLIRVGKEPISVNVPIDCIGIDNCPGIKLGGLLRQIVRHFKVSCVADKIPEKFEVDIGSLGLNGTKKLSDISMPKGVKPLVKNINDVAVVIARATQK